jgi:hypothetical protein
VRELDSIGAGNRLILDLSAVTGIWAVSERLLAAATADLVAVGAEVTIVGRDTVRVRFPSPAPLSPAPLQALESGEPGVSSTARGSRRCVQIR